MLPKIDASISSVSTAAITSDIISIVSHQKVIQVESVSSVIDLLQKQPGTYALSYYPVLNRYSAVANGELVYVPFRDYNAKSSLCLFYYMQAYQQHSLMQKLIEAIRSSANAFLSGCAP